MKRPLFLLLIGILLTSCASKESVLYFQNLENKDMMEAIDSIVYPKVEASDILDIRITALEQKSIIPFLFDKPAAIESGLNRYSTNRNMDIVRLEGYMVDKDGAINYPQLGKIPVKGLTTREIETKLEELLSTYVTNPTVSVRLVNFKVSVIGEVNHPGTYPISEDLLTLPQALGLAGDLTIKGKRDNVLVIRNKGDQRTYKYIDLTDTDWMNSDLYFLKQGDIVYVEPNKTRVKEAGFIGGFGSVVSISSLLISLAVLIFK